MKTGFVVQMMSIFLMGFLLMPIDLLAGEEGNTPGEAEFTVLGNCGMCKDRIERAAYSVRGVRSAEWNEEAQKIAVRYRPNRTDQEEIERAIAEVGHDTENFLADDETYENLHHCCIYPRDPEMLENNRRYDEE